MDLEKYKSGASPQEEEKKRPVVKMTQAKPFQYEKPVNVQEEAVKFQKTAAASRGMQGTFDRQRSLGKGPKTDMDEFVTKKQAYDIVKQSYRDGSGSSSAGIGAIAQQMHQEYVQRQNQNRQIQEAAAQRRAQNARMSRQMPR